MPLGFDLFDDDDDDFLSFKSTSIINKRNSQKKRQERTARSLNERVAEEKRRVAEAKKNLQRHEDMKDMARKVIHASKAEYERDDRSVKIEATRPPTQNSETIRVEEPAIPNQKEKLIRILESTLKMTDVFFDISREDRQQILDELKGSING